MAAAGPDDFRENLSPAEARRQAPIRWAFGRAAARADGLFERLRFRGRFDSATIRMEREHYHPDRFHYAPSGWSQVRRALPRAELSPSDVFLDLGCGKGRVVYVAARHYPFARVIGVDISSNLVEIARANIDHNRDRLRCQEVEFVTADVRSYEIPDDVTIAFYFWSFVGETFRATIANILASIERNPREVRLIVSPVVPPYLLETGRFRAGRRVRTWYGASLNATVSTWIAGPTP